MPAPFATAATGTTPAAVPAPAAPCAPTSVVSPLPPDVVAARTPQVAIFTPAVRRCVYNFLLNPDHPGVPVAEPSAAASAAAASGSLAFEVVLATRPAGAAGGDRHAGRGGPAWVRAHRRLRADPRCRGGS